MIKHSLRKVTSFILIISLILIQLLGNVQSAYAYSEADQEKIDAWFDTASKTEDPKNLLSYQDSVNAVFDSFNEIRTSSEDASVENLSQNIKTLIDALKSDSILDIIDIEGITNDTYDDKASEQKIKYELSLLNYDNYVKYIPSIVDILTVYMSEDIAFTRYANDTSATGEYCNAVIDLLHGIREGCTRVDESTWENEWANPSAYDYASQVDAIVTAYNANGSGMAEAIDGLVTELKKDTTLLALKDTGFTDVNNFKDEDWDTYYNKGLSCERQLTDFLYSINAEKLQDGSFKEYAETFQKRIKANLIEQESAFGNYVNNDKNSIGWAIQDLLSELYRTVKDVDEENWECSWVSPNAYDYEPEVEAIVNAYKANGEGMTTAVDQLVAALKNDSLLSKLKENGFTNLNDLNNDAWDNYYSASATCQRRVTDFLYSINAEKIEDGSYQFYINVYQKRLKENLDSQINLGEEERCALYRYINGDKDSIAWAIQDLIQELYHTVRDVDEATWESEWANPSAYDHQEIMNTIRRVYSSSETELTQAVNQLIAELKADQVIQGIKNNGYTDFSKLQSDASWQEYWNQNLPCERVIADYLYNMKANKMQGESYSAYISLLQKNLKDMIAEQAQLEVEKQTAFYKYLTGNDNELAWAITDIVVELYHTILEIDYPEPTPSEPTTGSESTPESTVPTTPTEEIKTEKVVGEDELTITTTTKTTTDENGNIKVEENKVVTDKEGTVIETIVTLKVEDKATGTTIETVLKKDSNGSVTDASTTLQTAIESKVTEEKAEIDIITPEKALINVAKNTVLEKPLDVTIKLPEKKIIEQLASGDVKEAEIKIPISSEVTDMNQLSITNINLSKDILASAKENRIDIKIVVTDEKGKEKYSMSFDSEKLEKSKKKLTDINLNLDIKAGSQSTNINKVLKNDSNNKANDAVVLNFSHSGVLPVTMVVNIYVGEQQNLKPGTKVFMYYMNPTTNKLDYLPNNEYTVGDDLFVKVNVNHCSEYVLLPNEVSKEVKADLLDQISIVGKKTLYVGGTKGSYFTLKPVMPSTIEQVSKFETIDDEAISEVKVCYATDNKKVVRVNKSTGKVVAIGTGKATISTTFQLANGEKKVVKTVVTVKKPSIKITSNTTAYKVGKEYKLTAKTYGLKGKVTWSVSNRSVAVIDKATGKIKIKKAGTVIVTATCDKVQKTYKIVVK
jgi:hypothetical protein